MKILSIDVGIKNLAYCLFELTNPDEFSILKWDVINLSTDAPTSKCCVFDKLKCCNKPAKFMKTNTCFCLKHAKKQKNYLFPTAEMKPAFINKQKVAQLFDLAIKFKVFYAEPINKIQLIHLINNHLKETVLDPVNQKINASSIDLVTIGTHIKNKFNNLFALDGIIDYVIIENQISPIANRMKTIQGMIAQYCIMREPAATSIQFVSASNKLKNVDGKKATYAERKKLGVKKCLEIISEKCQTRVDFFQSHKKKDDLSDSFLQGVWFMDSVNKDKFVF
jgi:hypothetical protein